MKIIFLDIDGVLNSGRSWIAFAHKTKQLDQEFSEADDPYFERMTINTIDPVAVGLVNKVLRDFDAKIVLSSSHRKHFPDGPEKLELIRKYLTRLGLEGERCIGFTPSLYRKRGEEIEKWLNDHRQYVTHYIVLDDAADFTAEQLEFHVHTDPALGVSEENYRHMTRLFGREDSGMVFL